MTTVAPLAFSLPPEVLALGAMTGLVYGLLAVGLVLVYRSSRFINFAHGEIGLFAAAVFALLVTEAGIPYWLALPLGLGMGALVAALTEALLVRRLARAPRLLSMVATLVLAQFLLVFANVVNGTGLSGAVFPQPTGIPGGGIWGAVKVHKAYVAMVLLVPVVVVALVLFFRKSRWGVAIRAAAVNPDAASLSAMSPKAMATMTWAIAGSLSALTSILVIPTRGISFGFALGPTLLLPGLAAAVIGRMRNVGVSFAAAVAIGIVEQVVSFNTSGGGLVAMILFVVILVALLLQSQEGSRERDQGSWLAIAPWPQLPPSIARRPEIRGALIGLGLAAVALAALLPTWSTNETAFVFAQVLGFAIVGMSVGYVTGLNGHLALGQFAIAGFGAWASWFVSSRVGSFEAGLAVAAVVGGCVSVLIGLPALRVRGLLLAVATLSFALAAEGWLLEQPWLMGGGFDPGKPIFLGNDLATAREYWYVALVAFLLAAVAMGNLRRSTLGRRLVALRDNEDAARALTIDLRGDTIRAYAVAGAFAGLGGAVYGHAFQRLDAPIFLAAESVAVVAMTVIGGIGLLLGPLVGALYVVAIPRLVDLDLAGRALHTFAILLVVVVSPGGLTGLLGPIRERWVRWVAGRAGVELDEELHEVVPANPDPPSIEVGSGRSEPAGTGELPLLQVAGVSKHYGGVTAVDDMSLEVHAGQTVGLIGPNGAGKTTFFEIISGFVQPDAGMVVFDGYDVTKVGPEARAQMGLVRSFQEARLFPTLTVIDTVELAHERLQPSGLLEAVLGRGATREAKRARARDLLSLMGLDAFRDKQIGELSTGTRRIAELTCMLAIEPRLLLLDEPAAGVAQRETEALGDLLQGVKDQLGTTLVVIEHDLPLLASICDRMVAMDAGSLLAEGTPDEVQSAPQVVDAFLGGDLTAVHRSGVVAG